MAYRQRNKVTRKPFEGPPWTVTRLQNLRWNESIVYYRGNLEADISRAGVDGDTHSYKSTLEQIQQAAWTLSLQKKIRLEEKVVPTKVGDIREYIAIGIK